MTDNLGLTLTVRTISVTEPIVGHTIGLVEPVRDPMTPLMAALLCKAKKLVRRLMAPQES